MGALARIRSWLTKSASRGAEYSANWFDSTSLLTSADMPRWIKYGFQPSDYADLQKRYLSWAYVCALRNAQAVACVPMRLYRPVSGRAAKAASGYTRDGESAAVVESHPSLDLIGAANEAQNWHDFELQRQLSEEVTGNAYAVLTSFDGEPQEAYLLDPPHMIAQQQQGSGRLTGWRYGGTTTYAPADVGHFRFPPPSPREVYGVGPMQACFGEIDIELLMEVHAQFTFVNRARPDFLLSPEGPIPDSEFKRLKREWNRHHRGPRQQGKAGILPFGLKPITLSMTADELGSDPQHKWNREMICAAFGIPMSMVTMEASNRAVAESGEYQYHRFTIAPRIKSRDNVYTSWLLAMFPGTEGMFFASDDNVPEDKAFRLQRVVALSGARLMTPNEARAEEGLDPIDGGDELRPEPTPSLSFGAPPPKHFKGVEEAPADYDDPKLDAIMQRVFREQKREVLAAMRGKSHRGNGHRKGETGMARPAGGWQSWMFGADKWDKIVADKSRPVISGIYLRAGKSAVDSLRTNHGLGAGVAFDVTNQEAVAAVNRTIAKFAAKVNGTTRERLIDLFETAIRDGWSMDTLRKDVATTFDLWADGDGVSSSRAEMIARSETARAVTAGTEEAYSQSGIEQKEWLTSDDACPFCLDMNGKRIGVGTPFYERGAVLTAAEGSMTLDYDDTDGPPLHTNCRCTLVPVVG